jgi:hypothetical protein
MAPKKRAIPLHFLLRHSADKAEQAAIGPSRRFAMELEVL